MESEDPETQIFTVTEYYRKMGMIKVSAPTYRALGLQDSDLPVDVDYRTGEDQDIKTLRLRNLGYATSKSLYNELNITESHDIHIRIVLHGTGNVLEFTRIVKDGEADPDNSELTLLELKDKLKAAGLSQSGAKAILVQRLKEAGIDPNSALTPGSCVWIRQHLRPLNFEEFKVSNKDWSPAAEADVYLAFKALEDFHEYKYCCGFTKELARKLGYKPKGDLPDSILLDTVSGEYRVGEFKKRSGDFKNNHHKDDVDVLVCWDDNEKDRDTLPEVVLHLRSLVKLAASQEFGTDET